MKARSLFLAFGATALCAAVLIAAAIPDAYAMVALAFSNHLPSMDLLLAAPVALPALRTELADLQARAEAKRKEIKDDTPADQVRAIEEDHTKILATIETKKREITAAEAEEATRNQNQPHAWSPEDIGKITARAAAFGLRGEVALAIMADPKIRTLEAITDALQDKAASDPKSRTNPHIQLVSDEGDKLRSRVGDAIALRANPQAIVGGDVATRERIAAAREFRGMSLLEIGRAFVQDGQQVNLRGLSRMELATVLLGMDTLGRSAGMHSTSDFANVLANVANKRLRDAYDLAPQLWKMIGRQSNNPDFKQKSVVQLSSAPSFKLVREGAEYTYGGLTDGVEKYALATYGRIIAITRQALINDDLSAFDRLPMMLGRQAAELEASTFWSVLTANAAMNDGTALFHADHGNLANASAIDTTNLGLMRAAMRKQKGFAAKGADAEPLNLTMKYIVVSPDKETEAAQAVTAVLATQIDKVNVFAGTLTVIPEARLSGNTWYGVADPATVDTIEYSYLEGEEGIFTEQRIGFGVDGIELKARVDFAAKAIDWRGMVKNPGA